MSNHFTRLNQLSVTYSAIVKMTLVLKPLATSVYWFKASVVSASAPGKTTTTGVLSLKARLKMLLVKT